MDHHHSPAADPNCKHMESGLYCHCTGGNAECFLCKGWFKPAPKKRQTWEEYQQQLVENLKKNKLKKN